MLLEVGGRVVELDEAGKRNALARGKGLVGQRVFKSRSVPVGHGSHTVWAIVLRKDKALALLIERLLDQAKVTRLEIRSGQLFKLLSHVGNGKAFEVVA